MEDVEEEEEEEMKHSITFGFLPCSWKMHNSKGRVFTLVENTTSM